MEILWDVGDLVRQVTLNAINSLQAREDWNSQVLPSWDDAPRASFHFVATGGCDQTDPRDCSEIKVLSLFREMFYTGTSRLLCTFGVSFGQVPERFQVSRRLQEVPGKFQKRPGELTGRFEPSLWCNEFVSSLLLGIPALLSRGKGLLQAVRKVSSASRPATGLQLWDIMCTTHVVHMRLHCTHCRRKFRSLTSDNMDS